LLAEILDEINYYGDEFDSIVTETNFTFSLGMGYYWEPDFGRMHISVDSPIKFAEKIVGFVLDPDLELGAHFDDSGFEFSIAPQFHLEPGFTNSNLSGIAANFGWASDPDEDFAVYVGSGLFFATVNFDYYGITISPTARLTMYGWFFTSARLRFGRLFSQYDATFVPTISIGANIFFD
jgi:hypothetical protein